MNPDSLYIYGNRPQMNYFGNNLQYNPVNYMENLYKKQSTSVSNPLMQMYELGMLDQKNLPALMMMNGASASDSLNLMRLLKQAELHKYAQDGTAQRSPFVHSQLEESLGTSDDIQNYFYESRLKALRHKEHEEVSTADDNVDEEILSDEVVQENSPEVLTNSEHENGSPLTTEWAANTALTNLFHKRLKRGFENKTGITLEESKNLYINHKKNSAVTKLVNHTKDWNNFDIDKTPADAQKWIEYVKENKHFGEYSIEDLRKAIKEDTFKGDKTQAQEFLNKVDKAEELIKKHAQIKPAEGSGKLVDDYTAANEKVKDLKGKLKEKNLSKSEKMTIQEQLKTANQDLKSTSESLTNSARGVIEDGQKINEAQSKILKKYKKNPNELGKNLDELEKSLDEIIKDENITKVEKEAAKIEKEAAKILKEKLSGISEKGIKSKKVLSILSKGVEEESKNLSSSLTSISKAAKTGKLASLLGKTGKVANRAAAPIAALLEGKGVYDVWKAEGHWGAETTKKAIKAVAATSASFWAGAATGAAIGTCIGGPIGTVVGGIAGLVVGGITYYATDKATEAVEDAIYTPDQEDLEVRDKANQTGLFEF